MEQYALWLTSWYPTLLSPYDGDFIQRHAKAVSLYRKIIVVNIKKDVACVVTPKTKKTKSINNNLTEVIVYYHPKTIGIKIIDKAISFLTYQFLYYQTIKEIIKENGIPFLIHAHIIKHISLICLAIKSKFKRSLVVSEHWSGFLQENNSSFKKESVFYKWIWKKVFRKANQVTVVSNVLGKSIQSHFGIQNFIVIKNVVDTSIFYPSIETRSKQNSFVHISNGSELKNIPKILTAFSLIKNRGEDFILHLFIPLENKIIDLINELGIKDNVILHGEVPQNKLAAVLQESSALILYSQYETFGCVVIEANAIGVPTILSDLEVFKEFCVENETCLFAKKDNIQDLADVIVSFIKNQNQFDKNKIAQRTKDLFSFDKIGKEFSDIYDTLLQKESASY